MVGFIVRRLLATIPVLLIVAVLVFLMLRLTPGDPAAILAGDAASMPNRSPPSARASASIARCLVQFESGSASCCKASSASRTSTRCR